MRLVELLAVWSGMKLILAMPIGYQRGFRSPDANYELREDLWPELREDGGMEVRE